MRIQILAVGKNMPSWVTTGYQEYAKRITPFATLELAEVKSTKPQALLDKLPAKNIIIALDVKGKGWDTPALAKHLQQWRDDAQHLSFVIGGPDGLDPAVLAKVDMKWSLSALTFPHPLVRIVLIEQLYRAFSILHSHPYHR